MMAKKESLKDVLIRAKARIENIDQWGRGKLFQYRNGHQAGPGVAQTRPEAIRCCALGAVELAAGDDIAMRSKAQTILNACAQERKYVSVVRANDAGMEKKISREDNHKLVMDIFDCAISKTK
jgi:hypothetical protein